MPPADSQPDDRLSGHGAAAGPATGRRHRPGAAGRTALVLACVGAAAVAGVFGARWVLDESRSPGCEFRAADRVETFSPEQSANAATIARISVQRGLPPRAASIALATAIQESDLRNIDYGDADSIGLFQQRPSQGWGSQEEILDPVFASHAFYDALEQVSGWQDMEITVAAQEVQRSAYPGAYADHEWEGRVLASALTGQTPAGIGCALPDPDEAGSAGTVLEKAQRQFGASGQVSPDGRLRLTAEDTMSAWATASWAVAHAEAESITTVEVAGQLWERDRDSAAWREGGEADAATVLITVAAP